MKKLLSVLAIMLITFTAYSVNYIPESIKVPKIGKTMLIERGQIAIVKVNAPKMPGWHNKMIIVEAVNDVELSNIVTAPQLSSGDLQIQREAIAKLGILLPWTYDKNRKYKNVNEPQLYLPSGEWVRHSRYKPMSNGLFFIRGEEIKTIERWEELNGGEGVFDQEIQDALYAFNKAELREGLIREADSIAWMYGDWSPGTFVNSIIEISPNVYTLEVVQYNDSNSINEEYSIGTHKVTIDISSFTIDNLSYSNGNPSLISAWDWQYISAWAHNGYSSEDYSIIGTIGELNSIEFAEMPTNYLNVK